MYGHGPCQELHQHAPVSFDSSSGSRISISLDSFSVDLGSKAASIQLHLA